MKKLLMAIVMMVALTSVLASADDKAAMDSKKQEMMMAWQKFSTPAAAHKVLHGMVGKWKYTSKWWEAADAKPQESSGTSTLKIILGGRFLQHSVKGKSMGMPFEGMGLTGYDNQKEKYETLWLDNMSTGVMHGTGTFDAATQTLKDKGEFSCPMAKKTREYKSEWKLIDKNNMTYTMWGPDMNDDEIKMMEMVFKRVK